MAPFDQDIQWSTDGINGARRFLYKIWRLYLDFWAPDSIGDTGDPQLERALHRTIRMVTEKIEGFRFNTMVSSMMEFVNMLSDRARQARWQTAEFQKSLEILLVIMAPAAPHITEELWLQTGHTYSVHQQTWPSWDAELAQSDNIDVAVQVDGRPRGVVQVDGEIDQIQIEAQARILPKVIQALNGRAVRKMIFIPGRMLNFLTEEEIYPEGNDE
jgi:leucyl-tRNA synthetase